MKALYLILIPRLIAVGGLMAVAIIAAADGSYWWATFFSVLGSSLLVSSLSTTAKE